MKKSSANFELFHLHLGFSNHGTDYAKRIKFDYWSVGFAVINSFYLRVSLCNQPSFKLLDRPIWFILYLINPITLNSFSFLSEGELTARFCFAQETHTPFV